ncbi:Mitochondrial transcription termination factor family protein [Raphanus sativus]|nr:Mitochondrial transcription termination factor family protein [Raphanus sativus]
MAVAAQSTFFLKLSLTKPSFPITTTTTNLSLPPTNRKPLFVFPPPQAHFPSPKKNPKDEQQRLSFTISYLINSCGLSPDYAIVAARKLLLDSPNAPTQFSTSSVTTVSPPPRSPASSRNAPSNPRLRSHHLDKKPRQPAHPFHNFLKSVLEADEKIVAALRRTTWIFLEDHTKNLVPNINHMSETGVPEKCVQLLLTHFPEAVMQRKDEFKEITKQAKEMGFNPGKTTFVLAIHALSGKGNRSIWDKCFEVYRRWGWSEDDIMCAFKKHPHSMMLSERKINRTMEFLVKEMNLEPRSIAGCPVVLFFSLDKRIIPRCSVVKVLASKGLVKEDWSLTSLLVPVEKVFLEKLVVKYEEELPELMDVYRGYTTKL